MAVDVGKCSRKDILMLGFSELGTIGFKLDLHYFEKYSSKGKNSLE